VNKWWSALGFFLGAARASGWETRGFEVSDFAASVAAQNPDLGVTCADFTSPEVEVEPGSFNAAVALDTIEHVLAPEVLLAKMHLALKEGGICLVSTGDITSLHASIAGSAGASSSPRSTSTTSRAGASSPS
jgi:2-polyprenyl-3-methyl-5-hydroxy-6-metoxy-1,4-benzoquinol methylase